MSTLNIAQMKAECGLEMECDRSGGKQQPKCPPEKRTTLSLSLTVSDKKALKMMAAERETTIAAIIHEWVAEHARKD